MVVVIVILTEVLKEFSCIQFTYLLIGLFCFSLILAFRLGLLLFHRFVDDMKSAVQLLAKILLVEVLTEAH